jgi:hypothetical protein
VELLKLTMVPLEVFQEQFRRLKEVEEGKDQLIEVSCLDDLFPISQTVLIEYFTDRT